MAKLSLLDMAQDIANDIEADAFNSIADTTESAQIAQIVKTCYFEVMSRKDWPFLQQKTAFTGLADTTNRTRMLMPEGMNKVFWVKYNGKDVTYIDPKEFQDLLDGRVETDDVVDEDGYIINADPLYWTTFDDNYVVFDGIDLDEDDTLQTSKCVAFGIVAPSWTHTDAFVPTMPEKMFPAFLAEAKSTAFLALKQQPNAKEEKKAQSGLSRMRNESWRTNDAETKTNSKINYGR